MSPAYDYHAMASLTRREREIMLLVSECLQNKEIGRQLEVSEGTVKIHIHHIFKKLQVANRTALALLARSSLSEIDTSRP